MQISVLNNEELARHAHIAQDPITTTELEVELLRRFEEISETLEGVQPIFDLMDQHGLDEAVVADLMRLLEEFCVLDIKGLRQKLERADRFYDIASEAGDLFSRLSDLTNSTL